MTEFPRGIDISKYQFSQDGSKKPNFDIINASGTGTMDVILKVWGYWL